MFRSILGTGLTAALTVGLLMGPQAASAQGGPQVCGPRDKIITRLSARYQERQSAIGMTSGGSLVELFVSAEGTWTFVHTNADGVTCLLAAGEDWELVLPTDPGQEPAQPS
ncbi:hypothetical protein [Pacificispira sp.]|uniref:hypothetical protein n=1 Tax=Pacificispira sp. TaxID=2888761 RepID=UPI003B528E8F